MLIGIFSVRLAVIQNQYEKLSTTAESKLEEPDEKLTSELIKQHPDKESVISLVSRLSAINSIKKEIDENNVQNSGNNVILDFIGIGILVLIGVLSAIEDVIITQLLPLLTIIGAMPVLLSAITFLTHLLNIQSFKKKLSKKFT